MTKKVMTEKRIYPGVNCFKLMAALFVIIIHTSPLTSFSAEADFVLTRILARTAVPFSEEGSSPQSTAHAAGPEGLTFLRAAFF